MQNYGTKTLNGLLLRSLKEAPFFFVFGEIYK